MWMTLELRAGQETIISSPFWWSLVSNLSSAKTEKPILKWSHVIDTCFQTGTQTRYFCLNLVSPSSFAQVLLALVEAGLLWPEGTKSSGVQMALWLLFPTCLSWPSHPSRTSCSTHFGAAIPDCLFFSFSLWPNINPCFSEQAYGFIHLCLPWVTITSCQIFFTLGSYNCIKVCNLLTEELNRCFLGVAGPFLWVKSGSQHLSRQTFLNHYSWKELSKQIFVSHIRRDCKEAPNWLECSYCLLLLKNHDLLVMSG